MTNPTPSPDVAELVKALIHQEFEVDASLIEIYDETDAVVELGTRDTIKALARAYEALRVEHNDALKRDHAAITTWKARADQAERDLDKLASDLKHCELDKEAERAFRQKAERDLAAARAALGVAREAINAHLSLCVSRPDWGLQAARDGINDALKGAHDGE